MELPVVSLYSMMKSTWAAFSKRTARKGWSGKEPHGQRQKALSKGFPAGVGRPVAPGASTIFDLGT